LGERTVSHARVPALSARFPIVSFLLGVWVVWFFCRLCFLALAVVLTVGLGLISGA
jgi:hypothetical protein